jgi:hypothetical protein
MDIYVCIHECEAAIISSYGFNRLFVIIETEFLYCPVRTESLSTIQVKFRVHIFNICCVGMWVDGCWNTVTELSTWVTSGVTSA